MSILILTMLKRTSKSVFLQPVTAPRRGGAPSARARGHRGTSPERILACILAVLMSPITPCAAQDSQTAPMADVHLHYNWDQSETLTPEEAVRRLQRNGVVLAVASGKPPSLALELAAAADGWIIPFFMPYLEPERKRDWFLDERVLSATRAALASGHYKGLGEVHLIVGFAPALRERHGIIDGLLSLGTEFDVPISLHVEAGSHEYFRPLCERHPAARIYWAHAGGVLKPGSVAALLEACPNVWVDMSALDPLRYGGSRPIVDEEGRLLPDWEAFALKYQDRIMVGSDPFYREGNLYWDEPNTGWDHIEEFIRFHRTWLSYLPQEAADKIRIGNARRLLGIGGSP